MKRKPTRGGTAVLGKPKATMPHPRVERVPVVVVLHPDGFIQVYGPRDKISAKIVPMLDVEPGGEALAEEFVDLDLSRRHRAAFQPNHLLAMGSVKDCRTPEQEVDRRYHQDIIRHCESARKESAQ